MKTVVIGLDGATFDIINPMIQAGRLANLSRLMREGSHAPLRSTILPNSFPGWSSCTTGTSEGMHGVFSPFIKNRNAYTVRAMSGRDIQTRHVWDLLTERGGRSMIINVPTTYPPEPLNGLMVTGMLTPNQQVEWTYPHSLKAEILNRLPDYIIEPGRHPDKHARAMEFRRASQLHEQLALHLMQSNEWDFFMVVFSVLDRAQHDFWADMDVRHPRHNPNTPREFQTFIHETYAQLDGAIGRLLEKLPAACRVFIVSDHGFCSELYEVRVNEVLAQAGLLTFKTNRKSQAQIKTLKEKVSRRLFGKRLSGNSLERKVQYGSAFLDEIDFTGTRAFFAQDKGVWVNLRGREPQGMVSESDFDSVVEEARAALMNLTSPVDGERIFESVMRREAAFNGANRELLPDLVMVPLRDEYVYNERPSYNEAIVAADSTTGTHAKDGIFIAWGQGIQSHTTFRQQPNLRDMGSTALASLECPLTEDMDGRAIDEIFQEPLAITRQGSSYRAETEMSSINESVYKADEEAELRERLRALGYIE
ncbi:MAG: alkaline phosphatase family protein [Acidobacteriota bacterium]